MAESHKTSALLIIKQTNKNYVLNKKVRMSKSREGRK